MRTTESACIKTYDLFTPDRTAILRYAGTPHATPEIDALLDSCLAEVGEGITGRVIWREFPIRVVGDTLDLTFAQTTSTQLMKRLEGCDQVVLFCATAGMEFDRMVVKHKTLSPARAHMIQAVGTQYAEALCDLFEKSVAQVREIVPRFSPGYGDLPLELQRDIFSVLDCHKIGVTLGKSLLMTPSKSVTALIGVKGRTL